ncbi:hyaluronidase PH-20-like [Suncus etruscus]|uniref:hyaluronidase PH-20-like n=1 Tax=Suncus etruscus TaxID=109475 RepID=UPI0021101124|nr:hyaluronidase PH-20-like [Suncus etruscus]
MEILRAKCIFFCSFVNFNRVSEIVFTFFLVPIFLNADYRAPPIISNTTYVHAWNSPSDHCLTKFKISLDLSFYSLRGNPQEDAISQNVTLFYINKLGLYPHINLENKNEILGGIPQLGNLTAHLEKAKKDILKYMPKDQLGLAVIDWEEWRPLWIRNWGCKKIYRTKSIEFFKNNNPNVSTAKVTCQAQKEFENAGKKFMLQTLELGLSLRPKNYWGFYLFPDCYNHDYLKGDVYTGNCPEREKERNNLLDWLWNKSTALYPSIYLNTHLKSTIKAALFSRNRIMEAIRLSKVRNPENPLPVFVYMRPVFTDQTTEFLSEHDLVNTIGESYALGASGIVIWTSFNLVNSEVSCGNLRSYLMKTLSPYLINVTLAAKLCNQALCKDQGICTRKDWNSSDYLHLNPNNFNIKFSYCNKFIVFGEPSVQDLKKFSEKFDCSCFTNKTCKKNEKVETTRQVRICITENVCISAFVKTGSSVIPYEETSETLIPSSTSAMNT